MLQRLFMFVSRTIILERVAEFERLRLAHKPANIANSSDSESSQTIIYVQSVRSRWATRSGCAADAIPVGIRDASRSLWWKATRSASSALHGQKMKSKIVLQQRIW